MAAGGKRQAIAFYFSVRIRYKILISKCRRESDLCMTSVLVKRMPLRGADFRLFIVFGRKINSLFDVRSGGKIVMKPRNSIATIQKRRKPCPISKKVRKKKGLMHVKIHGCLISDWSGRSTETHNIRMSDPPETRKTLSNLKKVGKKGENKMSNLQKPRMSDLRWGGNIDIKRRYSDARQLGDEC